jgi:hypothetical protein
MQAQANRGQYALGRSPAHLAIATTERAPAATAATANVRTVASW